MADGITDEPKAKKQKIGDGRRLNRFVYRELTTSNAEESKNFYTNLFGWDFREKQFEEGGTPFIYHTIFLHKGSEYQVGGMMEHKDVPPNWGSYISVEKIETAIEKIKANGGEILHGPFPCDYGKIAISKDSTGAHFSVIELADSTSVPDSVAPVYSFCWTQLMTSNVEESLKFYANVLNWKQKNAHDNIILTYEDSDHDCSVMKKPDGIEAPDHWAAYVLVNPGEVNSKAAEAEKLGGKIIVPPTTIPGIGRFSFILDPNFSAFAIWEVAHDPPKTRFNVITLLVLDQDEAKVWFEKHLGFVVSKDKSFGDLRWVTLKAPGDDHLELTLCAAKTEEDKNCVGKQAGSYPLFTINVANVSTLYDQMEGDGVHFFEKPEVRPWGTEVTFKDLYGNKWSMVQLPTSH